MIEKENSQVKEDMIEDISDLFLKYGLRSTSMEDICTHLKISKKTLYQFFANKDDVVEQVMLQRRNNRRVKEDIENLLQQNALEALLLIRDHVISDYSSRLPANMFDIKKYHPEVYEKILQLDVEFSYTTLRKLLNNGIKSGYFRKDLHLDIQIYLFTKQMSFLGEPEMISSIQYPMNDIISTIMENFIRSISTPKGISELEKRVKIVEK
ncbi:MAG: TetR/AcrR family transcriptional regulator [Odoribacter splanchnicus]|nr:TetR/AcrR family transcriptional regulator [Odoribacter splanchnicus]